jgi:hypothetical protein
LNAKRKASADAYNAIKDSATSTANDITRAEKAMHDQISAMNKAQFGEQTTLLETTKANWIKVTAAIAAAWVVVGKAAEYYELGAKAQQAEESFRMVAESSKIGADALLANLDRAAAGTVDDSDIMQQAVKGMILGLNDAQLVKIMENARIAARYAGTDVKTAFEEISNAIGTDMPRGLKQYGAITKKEMSDISAVINSGSKEITLYDIAMAHLEVNTAKVGTAHANASEKLQAFHALIANLKESFGKAEIAVKEKTGAYFAAGVEGLLAFATRAAAGLATVIGQEQTHNELVGFATPTTSTELPTLFFSILRKV